MFIVSLKYIFLKFVEKYIICISILLTVNNSHLKKKFLILDVSWDWFMCLS